MDQLELVFWHVQVASEPPIHIFPIYVYLSIVVRTNIVVIQNNLRTPPAGGQSLPAGVL